MRGSPVSPTGSSGPPGGPRPRLSLGRLDSLSAWVLFSAFAAGFGGVIKEFLYVYLVRLTGFSREELGSLLALAGIPALGASLAVGPAADRLGTGVVLASILAAGAAGYTLLSLRLGAGYVLAGLTLAQASVRSRLPLTRSAAAFKGVRAVAVGASNALSNLGMMAGILPGEGSPFLAPAALLLVALAVYVKVRGSRPP